MSGPYPFFWRTPWAYCRWAMYNRPALFWSVVMGVTGPVALLASIPIKRSYGWEPRPQIPMTYPVPTGPRKTLNDYDD